MCAECWTKVENFHKFYETVEEAKIFFLRNLVKEEEPNFVEINCDAVGFDDTNVFVKTESSDFGADNSKRTEREHDGTQGHDDFGSSSFFDFANDDESNDSDKCMAKFDEEHDPKVDAAAALAAAQLAIEVVGQVENTSDVTTNSSVLAKKKFDHLISKYMDMKCEICRHPFDTLSDASYHYRSKHQRRTAKLKCCQRRIKMPDIRDHIQYHLNPNMFK